MPSLTRDEAQRRAAVLHVTAMEVDLDLARGPETFGSRTRIRFTCREPAAGTFVEFRPVELTSLRLNGAALEASVRGGRVELTGLREENVLEAEGVMGYSHDGQGLHRAVDPADGAAYVYGHLFLDAAPTVFACFDQPDLKAPYAVHVTAPVGWQVLGNGAATQESPGSWRLATTRPLATYFVTVCAGPYACVLSEHDGIPLGLHARSSLRGPLESQAPQLFEVTRACLDYYHRLFGIRYPFGEYHQVFVPEFNAGAMENPGCVTFRDHYVFRGAAARDEVLARANTVAHEMAHMWFGDLVTMRWWDDLWLNESFAEYLAHRTLVEATGFTDAWVDSTMARKVWGYAAERSPSTHPVAGAPAPDARTALGSFDGISYAKGAATLRQLIAHLGDDAFVAGVRAYLRRHEYGNGTLADFLAAMEQSSGHDLGAWSRAWLETAGADTVSIDPAAGVLLRRSPSRFPADRPHTLDVAGFADGSEVYRFPVTVTSERTEVAGLRSARQAAVVVPNAGDLTWATVALDRHTVQALAGQLARLPDAQARAVVWVALLDGVALAEVDPRQLVTTFAAAWPAERNDSILSRVSGQLLARVVPQFLPPAEQELAEATITAAAVRLLDAAQTELGHRARATAEGLSIALVAARAVARASDDAGLLRSWAGGDGPPAGLDGDADLRWVVVRNLARRGLLDVEAIEGFRARDNTLQGSLNALSCRAALPDRTSKDWAWQELTGNRTRSNYEANALATGFWLAPDLDLVRDFVPRYFTEVPAMSAWLGEDALARVATLAYPSTVVEEATAEASRSALARGGLTPGLRRAIVDADWELGEALRSLRTFR